MVNGVKVTGFPNSTEFTKNWAKNGTLLPIEDKAVLFARFLILENFKF